LDDPLRIVLEQIAALQHVEHPGGFPVQHLKGRSRWTTRLKGVMLEFMPFKSMA